MRLGFDISPLTASRTGVGNYVQELGRALSSLGSDIEILGYASGRGNVDVSGLPESFRYRQVRVPTSMVYWGWENLGRPSAEWLAGQNLDVVHGTNFFLPATRGAKRVISVHDISFEVHPEWVNAKVVRPYASRMKVFCEKADKIITFSEFTKSEMMDRYGTPAEKIHVTPHGIRAKWCGFDARSARARAQQLAIRDPFLLYVGTLEERKNIARLLEAFASLKELPQKLVLVGNAGFLETPLNQMIENLGIRDRVIRPGYVAHDDLSALYRTADAFLFPSLYEGFGFPVLEAFASECPVVVSNTTCLPEVGGDAVEYVDPMDVADIARGIERVVLDREYADELRSRGTERMKLYSWDKTAQDTADVYRSVL